MADSDSRSSSDGCVPMKFGDAGRGQTGRPASYHEIRAKHQQAIADRRRVLAKGLLLTFVVLTMFVLVFNVIDFDSFGPGVTLASYRRLHVGMGEHEVEAILGSRGRNIVPFREQHVRHLQDDEKFWKGKKLVIYAAFAKDNRVRQISMTWHGSTPQPESITQTLGRWFGVDRK
ncbi:MAG: hypothetical protein L0Y71_14065 [Gemmataceae bacterium]|nr:hypothetical protein [Gemmataceae bacterium]